MKVQVQQGTYSGFIQIPSSKSDGQRAILAAALSSENTELIGIGQSNDEQQMLKNIQQLGAVVEMKSAGHAVVKGIQAFPSLATVNAGESGLGVRLITSVCAAHPGLFEIIGEGSLLSRPQRFFEDHYPQMGVTVHSNGGLLPIKFEGPLKGGKMEVDSSMSSQFLSGLLMALPRLKNDSELIVRDLKSTPYAQMTLDTLRQFGIEIQQENVERFTIRGNQDYQCDSYQIEADWSSASYWLVAAALGHDIQIAGLNQESLQADKALLDALQMANCTIGFDENGVIRVYGEDRKPFEFDATHCPDLFPALVSLAAFCDGDSVIHGVNRLANKESNRGVVLQKEFGKLGLRIELNGNEMVIHGGVPLKSARVDSNNDHRIAMCLAVAGMNISGGLEITGAESVAKSYPGFWDDLTGLL